MYLREYSLEVAHHRHHEELALAHRDRLAAQVRAGASCRSVPTMTFGTMRAIRGRLAAISIAALRHRIPGTAAEMP